MSGPTTGAIRVLVVDDQAAVREGLVMLLGLLDRIDVVGSASDGIEAVALADRHRPDVVLMDLRMPRCDGIEATRLLRRDHPQIEIVVLTTHADDETILDALAAGARGYLTKDAGRGEIGRAIEAAAAGQTLLDPSAQRALLDAATRAAPVARRLALPDGLTTREAEVLALIATGLSNGEIASQLFVTEATVKSHVNHIFSKTGVKDRAQAVHYAYANELADPGPPASG